jgi:peptide-methionine (R)-S-oxide reductase
MILPDKSGKTEAEWEKALTEKQYYILRKQGERPFQNEFNDNHKTGHYFCSLQVAFV